MSKNTTAQDIIDTHAAVPFTLVVAYRNIGGRTVAAATRVYDCGHVIGTPPCVEDPSGKLAELPPDEASAAEVVALIRDVEGMVRSFVLGRKINGFIEEHIDEIVDAVEVEAAKLQGLN